MTTRRTFLSAAIAMITALAARFLKPHRDAVAGESRPPCAASALTETGNDPAAAGDCPVDVRHFGDAPHLQMDVMHRSKSSSAGLVKTFESAHSGPLTADESRELVASIEQFYSNWRRGNSAGYPRDVWGWPQRHRVRVASVDGSHYLRLLIRYVHIRKA